MLNSKLINFIFILKNPKFQQPETFISIFYSPQIKIYRHITLSFMTEYMAMYDYFNS